MLTAPRQETFPVCVLPGCRALVTVWGLVCQECQAVFGEYLAPPLEPRPRLTREDIHARDDAIHAALADRHHHRRPR